MKLCFCDSLKFHPQVDKDGNGSISLSEYFEIFSKHGIEVNRAETNRWKKYEIGDQRSFLLLLSISA